MLAFLALAVAATIQVPTGPALTQAIAARDAALFHTFFEECDLAKMTGFLAPDLEFYHDRGGKVAGSAQAFVDVYATQCEARKKPDAFRSRRELVADSLYVDPIPGFGAVEEGDHLFYERQGDGPEKLTGKAHFVQLWQLGADGVWRLSRVLSYKHQAAGGG
ncbi:MAG TPA: DUF4440 domain-containing protein [Sphingomonas sp.]|uniref:DUF4440 domain-containing protein n=1 Tax=Sphingomonas sp. TaxID=28214 RepID=UPI002CCC883A|nr:DUF4440 domain-containing protein [Sphingomonas sp.]HMI18565.1 DUF4440 domain-containing protein [Sphingomonas sp.]